METPTQSLNCKIVFVLGPPGSGKGTLCNLTCNNLNMAGKIYHHLSVGDYLRELCEIGMPCEDENFDFDRIRIHLRDSRLLPANVLIPVLKYKMRTTPNGNGAATTWLIDGFPRNMETALAFEKEIGGPAKVVVLECTHHTARHRFLTRSREKSDDEKKFERRYDEYVENMKEILKHYEGKIETICVDGPYVGYSHQFLCALPVEKAYYLGT
ncbi:P-loop containing nucleoside triphosphate hydrolase protein [Annulohypoxylon maeteangense]|uniref:P-loop containing nucleoside triphosphate hydrolase protein n=1 Tax=Annulohypoxylon maeteangense TaxID=1927788 RepID=UPI0020073A64|nr:P-loop containing nucleoside triphosphate hydrolase protein [Annulohypoxylon maeteangense]KAI0888084.1 P-loop containing nucleoside triphosphate hydrolase protein [Annulohypoxylon maeteangense]